uniref:Uncharacterized protein n=1 Tax=Schizaphis graminum TaxID=13262 RepID=A0A2S2NXJ2_SCHGA
MEGEGDGNRGTPTTSNDNLLVVATSSTGLLDEFLNQIRAEIELNSQALISSDSSSDSEEVEGWYLPRFDIYKSLESLDEPPSPTSYRVEHLTAEPLTSDEEEVTLATSISMDETTVNDSVVDPVSETPEPVPKKRRSWLSALGRAVLSFGRKMCCCGGGRRRRRGLATDASSE